MKIPKIIHQTWKTGEIPKKWAPLRDKAIALHPGWEYRLWADEDNDKFVKENYPEFYDTFSAFPKNIMRADVIRYLIMDKIGGLYLDLDYEMLAPFDWHEAEIVIPMNRSKGHGDPYDGLGNCFFASAPGVRFWKDVIENIKKAPPAIDSIHRVVDATGPKLLTKVYFSGEYPEIETPGRMEYHPPTPKNRKEYEAILNNGISKGIHHSWGSWVERYTLGHLKEKAKRIFKK